MIIFMSAACCSRRRLCVYTPYDHIMCDMRCRRVSESRPLAHCWWLMLGALMGILFWKITR